MNPEYEMLFEEFMWDTHKAKFLPLTVNYNVKHPVSNIIAENYLHMIRLPMIWFKRRDRLAFDDRPADRWRWVRWWYYVIAELVEEKILAHEAELNEKYDLYARLYEKIENQPRLSRQQLNQIRFLFWGHGTALEKYKQAKQLNQLWK